MLIVTRRESGSGGLIVFIHRVGVTLDIAVILVGWAT